jgi:hypothetical protein
MAYLKGPVITPDWMKTSEVAARMGCTQMTVRNRLKRGSIPVRWTVIERSIHVNRAQFFAWLEGEGTKAIRA